MTETLPIWQKTPINQLVINTPLIIIFQTDYFSVLQDVKIMKEITLCHSSDAALDVLQCSGSP